jgi:hypothetical protein
MCGEIASQVIPSSASNRRVIPVQEQADAEGYRMSGLFALDPRSDTRLSKGLTTMTWIYANRYVGIQVLHLASEN